MGGDVRLNQEGFHIGHKEATKEAMQSVVNKGGKPFYIPAGASDHELGGLGFTNFVVELAEQEAQLGIFFVRSSVSACPLVFTSTDMLAHHPRTHSSSAASLALHTRGSSQAQYVKAKAVGS